MLRLKMAPAHSSMEWEGFQKPMTLTDELQTADGESVFFKGVVSGRSNMLQWKASHLRIYKQHKLELMGH